MSRHWIRGAALAVVLALAGCWGGPDSDPWIQGIEERNPVLADLEIESADRVGFGRIGQRTDSFSGRRTSGGHVQSYEPKEGFDVADVLAELRAVAEGEGWQLEEQPRPEEMEGEAWCGIMEVGDEVGVDVLEIVQTGTPGPSGLPIIALGFSPSGVC